MATSEWTAWISETTDVGVTIAGSTSSTSSVSGTLGSFSEWSAWVSGTTLPEWSELLTITTTGDSAGTVAVTSGGSGTLPRGPAAGVVSALSTSSGSLDLVSALVGTVELVTTVIGAVELRQITGIIEITAGTTGSLDRQWVSGQVPLCVLIEGVVSAQGPISYDAMELAQEILQRLTRPRRRQRWRDPSATMHGEQGADSSLYWYGR